MASNFNPGFDREKKAFLELANRGEGLAPINYLYAKEASFESISSPVITGGTAELYTIYTTGINIWTLPLVDGTDGQVLSTNGNGILSFIDAGGGKAPDDATYILQQPSSDLPNAQALDQLNNGLMKNNDGVIQIAVPGEDYLSPNLPSKQLFIGNTLDIATAQPYIDIENLPRLGARLTDHLGKIWRGTLSGQAEESDALSVIEVDLAQVSARLAYVQNISLPELRAQIASLNTELDLLRTGVNILNDRVIQISAELQAAITQIEEILVAINGIETQLAAIESSIVALETSIAAIEGEIIALQTQVIALEETVAAHTLAIIALQVEVAGVLIKVSSMLNNTKVIVDNDPGGLFGSLKYSHVHGSGYVSPDPASPQYIALQFKKYMHLDYDLNFLFETAVEDRHLGINLIAKQKGTSLDIQPVRLGLFSTADDGDRGYYFQTQFGFPSNPNEPSRLDLNFRPNDNDPDENIFYFSRVAQCLFFSKAVNFTGKTITNVGNPNTDFDGVNKKYVDDAISKIPTNITLEGDVIGNGLLNDPIVTTFKPNPIFTGNESMTMPAGNSMQRPTTLIPGMIRFNTSL